MKQLEGKTAVITGGSSGIGLATAKLFQQEGARVVVTGRNPRSLEEARAHLGESALVLASNTAELADIDALVSKVKSSFGSVDVLFVNAGIAKFLPFDQVTESFYDETQSINTKGAFFTVQKFAPLLTAGSSVVFNTSVVNEKGMAQTSVYAASKAALRSLTRTLATELSAKGVRVNAVSPGPIATPIYGKLGMPAEARDGFEAAMRDANPMKRFGTADEVAQAALYLAVHATYTTGAELSVDGGLGPL